MASIRKMNKALFYAASHLREAGLHLSNVEEFGAHSDTLLKMADDLLAVIKPEKSKITEEKMDSILDEIMDFGEKDNG